VTSLASVLRCVAGGVGALILTATRAAAAPVEAHPEPTPLVVVNTFLDALNARAIGRASALLADDAIIVDERGEYVGEAARDWVEQGAKNGIHLRLASLSGLEADERSTPDRTRWMLTANLAFSWDIDRTFGFAPQTRAASAIVEGTTIHSFRLQALRLASAAVLEAPVSSPERPAEPGSASAWLFVIVISGLAVLGVLARLLRDEPRAITSAQPGMLKALHQATLRRRAAATSRC
jgi:hypothetical protein